MLLWPADRVPMARQLMDEVNLGILPPEKGTAVSIEVRIIVSVLQCARVGVVARNGVAQGVFNGCCKHLSKNCPKWTDGLLDFRSMHVDIGEDV